MKPNDDDNEQPAILRYNPEDRKIYSLIQWLEDTEMNEVESWQKLPIVSIGYDSSVDTLKHIKRVSQLLTEASIELLNRAMVHDDSKLKSPEKELFDKYTPLLAGSTYGSEQYKRYLIDLKEALTHHYSNNSHHPEYYDRWRCKICNEFKKENETWLSSVTEPPVRFCFSCSAGHAIFETAFNPEDFKQGINSFDLFDLVEMFFDWKAATERHDDGDIYKSIELNKVRFNISEQICEIFKNTALRLNYLK